MGLRSVALCVLGVCGVVRLSRSFNVDVRRAKVFEGSPGTGFGFTAEFFRAAKNGDTSLLVGAPKETVTDPDHSGIYYHCDPSSEPPSCTQRSSPCQSGRYRRVEYGGFGERQELFGLALAKANDTTAVVCGPLWTDLDWSYQNKFFWIGRCHVLSPGGDRRDVEGLTPFRDQKKYQSRLTTGRSASPNMLYGAAEFGFSADGDGDGRVVVGAPGYHNSRGGVVVLDAHFRNFSLMTQRLDAQSDACLGYAVAVGRFCGPQRFCFVVSNRAVHGRVHMLEYLPGSGFIPLLRMKGKQEYSSFGSALSAVDVSGDGWADLLVGAPTYTVYGNDTRAYDQGRVFVYLSQGEVFPGQENFVDGASLTGDEVNFSRFGSAISSIGDINRDSINDIAVGAPLEEDGAGAVYIYLGSRDGPANRYSQKIRGRDFSPPLTSFGAHISKPTSALSDYHYPAFAVGAPLSSAVVVLKTRLIVNAHVSVEASPNPVEEVNLLCPDNVGETESGCINVTLCLNATVTTTSGLASSAALTNLSLYFNVALKMDQLISADVARRVRLYNPMDNTTTTSLHLGLTLTPASPLCLTYLTFLQQDQINRNPFLPVELKASFGLNGSSSLGDITPILNQSLANSTIHQVTFKEKCGEDQKCQADLELTGDVQYVPTADDKYPFNVINQTKQVVLALGVVNKGETAFGLTLNVQLSGPMTWISSSNAAVMCSADQQNLKLKCRSYAFEENGRSLQLRLVFEAGSMPLEPKNRFVTFDVDVMPINTAVNPEKNPKDNNLTLESRTAIVADARLNGSATPSVIYLADSDLADVSLTHRLLITNRGPSFLPSTSLLLKLPFKHSPPSPLAPTASVRIKQEGETTDKQCSHVTDGKDSFPDGDAAGQLSSTLSSNGSCDVMDCGRYRCRTYQCPLWNLQAGQRAEVNVTVIVHRTAIKLSQDVGSLLYVTTAWLKEPSHALSTRGTRTGSSRSGVVSKVVTHIKRVSMGEEIDSWYIIGGVLVGLILILIIGVVAWKAGCLERKDRARLNKLQKESMPDKNAEHDQPGDSGSPPASTSAAETEQ